MVLILAILTGFIYFLLNFRNMILTADTAVIVRTIDSLIYTLYFLVLITTILILILANKNFRAIVFLFFLSGEFLTGLDIVNKFESGSTDMSQYAMPIIVKVLYPFVFGIILTSIFLIFMSLKRRFIRDRK